MGNSMNTKHNVHVGISIYEGLCKWVNDEKKSTSIILSRTIRKRDR